MYSVIVLLCTLLINPKLARVNTQIQEVTQKLYTVDDWQELCRLRNNITALTKERYRIIIQAGPGEL